MSGDSENASSWIRNRCQTVVNRVALRLCGGTLRSCRGARHSNLTKVPLIYSVSYFNLGGIGAVFGGAKPTKAPRGDRTVWIAFNIV